MSDANAVEQAKALLIRRRQELTAELHQITEALAALGHVAAPVSASGAPPQSPQQRPSVRTMLLNLLNEDDRDWSAGEILEEYTKRGTPVHGADPNNALRAAIADANRAGQIVRTSLGRYKSAKWQTALKVTDAFIGGGEMEGGVATG